jgi:hypothetical protein
MENFNLKKYLAEGKLQEDQNSLDKDMLDLQDQLLPLLEEYIRLYAIDLGADIEAENPDEAPYILHRKEFLADLKVVLFKLQHGEY